MNLSHWLESFLAYKYLKISLHVGNVFSYVHILESRNIPRSECTGSKVISIFSS